MATGTYPGAYNVTTTQAANFIPELWSDEVIAAYKANLVVANLVTKINHKGKKGDTIHIPTPTRDSATAKAANTAVTLIYNTEGVTNITIDKHYEYSRLIEDIVEVQALSSLRRFYTDDAGYALAKQVDTNLYAQFEALNGGTVGGTGASAWETAVIGGDGSTTFTGAAPNATDITDAGIRAMQLTLDNADVPMDNRVIVIPPVAKMDLLGLARFTEQAFVGEVGGANSIRTGRVGNVYGMEVFITTNAPTVETSYRAGCMFHKDAICLVEQMGVRSQTQYKQEYLGDLFTADTIYGVGELRNDAGVAFIVPST